MASMFYSLSSLSHAALCSLRTEPTCLFIQIITASVPRPFALLRPHMLLIDCAVGKPAGQCHCCGGRRSQWGTVSHLPSVALASHLGVLMRSTNASAVQIRERGQMSRAHYGAQCHSRALIFIAGEADGTRKWFISKTKTQQFTLTKLPLKNMCHLSL